MNRLVIDGVEFPSPYENGEKQYHDIMKAGSARQKEALLIVLRTMHCHQLGPHGVAAMKRAAEFLVRSMELPT